MGKLCLSSSSEIVNKINLELIKSEGYEWSVKNVDAVWAVDGERKFNMDKILVLTKRANKLLEVIR